MIPADVLLHAFIDANILFAVAFGLWKLARFGLRRAGVKHAFGTELQLLNGVFLAIVLSLGLMTPWAKIRLAKYRAEQTQLVLQNGWDEFVASERRDQSALGEELGDAFDVGVDVAF